MLCFILFQYTGFDMLVTSATHLFPIWYRYVTMHVCRGLNFLMAHFKTLLFFVCNTKVWESLEMTKLLQEFVLCTLCLVCGHS